jgi:hypothetical protein
MALAQPSTAPTTPAFVHRGTWDETTRKHPAMKWMEAFNKDFDTHGPSPKWYTADASFQKADGTEFHGREQVMVANKELYGSLTSYFHEPYFVTCNETEDGYEMLGQAKLFANLPGKPSAGERKVKDKSGKEWDMSIPGAFHFWYVNDEKAENGLGIAIKRTEIMSDGSVPMGIMLKRGLISAQDLGL